jgi:hypothetical protein
MENSPEMTSNEPVKASPTDDVTLVEDVAGPVEMPSVDETASEDVTRSDSLSADNSVVLANDETIVATVAIAEAAAPDIQEAPAPQVVQLFDMGDDLDVPNTAPAFDMADETVEPVVSSEIDVEPLVVATNDVDVAEPAPFTETAEEPTASVDTAPTDDEIFEQVMGSSRAEDIPMPRRSTPGSIPLPPQVVLEQQRREQATAQAPDAASRKRYPLPETGQRGNRQAPSGRPEPVTPSQATPQAVDVICPKCQRTTSTRFTFCMKCGTDFPPGYVASLTGHVPKASTPDSRSGVRDTRSTVRRINRIHESREQSNQGAGTATSQTAGQQDWNRSQSSLASNPFLVAFLSFLMPGLGHMLMGEYKKGLPWVFAGIAAMAFLPSWTFLMWIPVFLRVFSAINAYQLAVIKQDEQREPFDSDDDA